MIIYSYKPLYGEEKSFRDLNEAFDYVISDVVLSFGDNKSHVIPFTHRAIYEYENGNGKIDIPFYKENKFKNGKLERHLYRTIKISEED